MRLEERTVGVFEFADFAAVSQPNGADDDGRSGTWFEYSCEAFAEEFEDRFDCCGLASRVVGTVSGAPLRSVSRRAGCAAVGGAATGGTATGGTERYRVALLLLAAPSCAFNAQEDDDSLLWLEDDAPLRAL